MYAVVTKYKDTTLIRGVKLYNKLENAKERIKYLSSGISAYTLEKDIKADTENYYENNIVTIELIEVELPED